MHSAHLLVLKDTHNAAQEPFLWTDLFLSGMYKCFKRVRLTTSHISHDRFASERCQTIPSLCLSQYSSHDDTLLAAVLHMFSSCYRSSNITTDTAKFFMYLSADFQQQDLKLCSVKCKHTSPHEHVVFIRLKQAIINELNVKRATRKFHRAPLKFSV